MLQVWYQSLGVCVSGPLLGHVPVCLSTHRDCTPLRLAAVRPATQGPTQGGGASPGPCPHGDREGVRGRHWGEGGGVLV